MKTIVQQINNIKKRESVGLMTHVVVGYSSLPDTSKIIAAMEKGGADFIELQFPFSDPLADGPTIMKANDIALQQGITADDCFMLINSIKGTAKIPLLIMCYYNTVLHYGVKKFIKKASAVGVQGLIVPDMPVDEEVHEHFFEECKYQNMMVIPVLSPTSTNERAVQNAMYASGFVYCTSRAGTTGTHVQIATELQEYLKRIKTQISVPLAVGFGISTPAQVSYIRGYADIAVVGSAVIDLISNQGIMAVEKYISSLRSLS